MSVEQDSKKSTKQKSAEPAWVICLKSTMLLMMLIAFAAIISAATSLNEQGVSKSTGNGGGSSDANSIANLGANLSDNPNYINFSQNNSSIRWESKSKIVRAPASISVGSGYYSSHPISYGDGIGSDTWVKNGGSAASMNHAVRYAHGIDEETEVVASESSYHLGDFRSSRTSNTRMMVNENVTQGQVHIGVLQGKDLSNRDPSGERMEPTATALKSPVVEMEEDYIGTYHIYKNMSITTPIIKKRRADSWLDFCGGGCIDMYLQGPSSYRSWYYPSGFYPWSISEDRVFNCSSADAGRDQIN